MTHLVRVDSSNTKTVCMGLTIGTETRRPDFPSIRYSTFGVDMMDVEDKSEGEGGLGSDLESDSGCGLLYLCCPCKPSKWSSDRW